MRKLSVGKIRGLQQIATKENLFIICALDHRGSLQKMMAEQYPGGVGYKDMVERKMELTEIVIPYASGILLDPVYGAPHAIARSVLPGNKGLLVSIEATGYENTPGGRVTTILDNWSVEKIKKMGASAVKMLLYYRPDMEDAAKVQMGTVKEVAADCAKYDIPFLLEPITYPVETRGTQEYFSEKKAELVIKTAEQLTSLGIDVLKAEFPADIKSEKNEDRLLEKCYMLSEASQVPWVLLSAGVDYDTFKKQVQIACMAGASGFLGGRAIWQESVHMQDKKERIQYLKTVVTRRLEELADITSKYAVPWYQKLGLRPDNLIDINESWYRDY
jgi:tagatose 1,6-diphosphate aldolase